MALYPGSEEEPPKPDALPILGLTEGRSVHFVGDDGRHCAAIITAVLCPVSGECDLVVFARRHPLYETPGQPTRRGSAHNSLPWLNVRYSPETTDAPNTWHFIERA